MYKNFKNTLTIIYSWVEPVSRRLIFLDYLIIGLAALSIGGYLLFFDRKKTEIFVDAVYDEYSWDAGTNPPDKWQNMAIQVGDKAFNSIGAQVAEIKDIAKTPFSGGNYELMYLTLKLSATYNKNTQTYTLDGRPLLVGNRMTLNTTKANLNLKILNVYPDYERKYTGFEKTEAVVMVKAFSHDPWMAEKMKTMVVKNAEGKVLLEALDTVITPAEVVEPNSEGQLVITYNPLKRDVILKLKLYDVFCKLNSCFYNKEIPLVIGSTFWADTGDLVIGPSTSIMSYETLRR